MYLSTDTGGYWNIWDNMGSQLYFATATDTTQPPKTGWQVDAGAGPAPTLAY